MITKKVLLVFNIPKKLKIATNAMMFGCRGVLYTPIKLIALKDVQSQSLQTCGKYQVC